VEFTDFQSLHNYINRKSICNTYRGLFGIGNKKAFRYVIFNRDIHNDPKDSVAEYIGSFVFNASELLYIIIEIRCEITPDGTPFFYYL